MTARKAISLCAALFLCVASSGTKANIISANPFSQISGVGEDVSVQISMDFLDNTVGGAFDLFYDATILEFVSFEFDDVFVTTISDPAFSLLPENCFVDGSASGGCAVGDGELNAIGFGSFDGIEGVHTIGTVTFRGLDVGTAAITMAINDAPFEGFYSSADASELSVLFTPAKVRVVPIPGAGLLLLSALGIGAGLGKKREGVAASTVCKA